MNLLGGAESGFMSFENFDGIENRIEKTLKNLKSRRADSQPTIRNRIFAEFASYVGFSGFFGYICATNTWMQSYCVVLFGILYLLMCYRLFVLKAMIELSGWKLATSVIESEFKDIIESTKTNESPIPSTVQVIDSLEFTECFDEENNDVKNKYSIVRNHGLLVRGGNYLSDKIK